MRVSPAQSRERSRARATAAAASMIASLPRLVPATTSGRSASRRSPAIAAAKARTALGQSGTSGASGSSACATANPSRAISSGTAW
jgi:hypothetical protein